MGAARLFARAFWSSVPNSPARARGDRWQRRQHQYLPSSALHRVSYGRSGGALPGSDHSSRLGRQPRAPYEIDLLCSGAAPSLRARTADVRQTMPRRMQQNQSSRAILGPQAMTKRTGRHARAPTRPASPRVLRERWHGRSWCRCVRRGDADETPLPAGTGLLGARVREQAFDPGGNARGRLDFH